jgi:hypothetical protein
MNTTTSEQRRLQFGLRFLICSVAALALLLTLGLRIYDWYKSAPSIPLADAVASFNGQYLDDPVGKFEPPVIEAEILASIRAQLPNLPAKGHVKAIYAEILRTRRIPQGASLHADSSWELRNGTRYTVWWINLGVPTGKNSGYALRIRENNAPAAKPDDEPTLKRTNLSWITASSK